MTPAPVHQLARVTAGNPGKGIPANTLWARCGARRPHHPTDRLPVDVTAAHTAVTCDGCLHPPSWADARIPT